MSKDKFNPYVTDADLGQLDDEVFTAEFEDACEFMPDYDSDGMSIGNDDRAYDLNSNFNFD